MSKVVQLLKRQFVEPYQRIAKILEQNTAKDGGLFKRTRGVLMTQMRVKDLRYGTQVGSDKYGNKYFENNDYQFGRNRWVIFNDDSWKAKWGYDASQVPAEWHRWLHQMTDDTPTKLPPTPSKFFIDHVENKSGKPEQYMPYSTTRPKVEAWKPN